MKRLIALALLLGFTGCKVNVEDRKNVVCFHDDVCTYRGIAKGNVYVVGKNDTHYFVFTDEQGEQVILDLSNQQCGIN